MAGLGIALIAIIPWLQHNWISTLGGTQRAVIAASAEEGDPGLLQMESWIWYPRLLPKQVGVLVLGGGLAGWLLQAMKRNNSDGIETAEGMGWLTGTAICVLIATSLSPNKDARYIAPLLPLLSIILARGWLLLLQAFGKRPWQRAIATAKAMAKCIAESQLIVHTLATLRMTC